MTKWTISFEGDTIEDKDDFDCLSNWSELATAIYNLKNEVRSRSKHGKDVSDEEEIFHDRLFAILSTIKE